MSAAREEVLSRVRSAIAGSVLADVPRDYRRELGLDRAARVELFCERVADYRATVRRVDEGGVAVAAGRAVTGSLLVPDGVPEEWLPARVRIVRDRKPGVPSSLSPAELDGVDAVLTGCTLGVAETGTIVLTSGPSEGRRALTLVPDLHVCIVRATQLVDSLPAAIAVLRPLVYDRMQPLTLISGPSATSDIELDRVEGVHGPRTLVVVVVEDL